MSAKSSPSGVVIVDKPRGMTSHDVVSRARRALRTKEIGHAGTLDPMATGVLVLGVGQGTKLLTFLSAQDKLYEATVVLGVTTETLDADGLESATMPIPTETLDALDSLNSLAGSDALPPVIAAAVGAELARTAQMPPIYSAIHTGGDRAHVLARKGIEVTLAPRPVTVHELHVVSGGTVPGPHLVVRVRADKGYYVRSLGRDLGESLGTVAHLSALRRVRSGAFDVSAAVSLEVLAERGPSALLGLAEAASLALPVAILDDSAVIEARHGKLVHHASIGEGPEGPVAWLGPSGDLVAVGARAPSGEGRVVRGFSPTDP